MERRKLLAVLGGSASVGLAGCLGGGGGGDDNNNNSSDDSTDDDSSENGTENGTEAEANFEASFEVTGSLKEGEEAVVEWTVQNTGEAEATQTVTFAVGGSQEGSTEVTLAGGESDSGEFTFTPSSGGDRSLSVATDDDESEQTVTVEALAEANFAVSLDNASGVTVGSDLVVGYTVENTGDVEATQSVVFSVAGTQEGTTELTLGGGASESGEFTYAPSEEDIGELSVSVATDDDEATATVEIVESEAEVLEPTGSVVAESQSGLLGIGQPTREDAEQEGFALPPSDAIDEPVVVDGDVSEDGSWESTAVEFPPVPSEEFFPIDELPVDGAAVEISAPDGVSGEIDYEAGTMTFDGTLEVAAFIDSGSGLPDEPNLTVDISLSGTTGTSNNLEGSFNNEPPVFEVTIVDNESTIPALDPEEDDVSPVISDIVNQTLGLPSEEGETWLILDFEIESTE